MRGKKGGRRRGRIRRGRWEEEGGGRSWEEELEGAF